MEPMPLEACGLLHSRGRVARRWGNSHHRKSMGLNHPRDPDLTDAPSGFVVETQLPNPDRFLLLRAFLHLVVTENQLLIYLVMRMFNYNSEDIDKRKNFYFSSFTSQYKQLTQVEKILWRRKWQTIPALLPGKSRGWRGHKESNTTERLHFHFMSS